MTGRHARPISLAVPLALTLAVSLLSSSAIAANVPPCAIADELVEYSGRDWATVVLDTQWRLAADYAPGDLVPVRLAKISGSGMVRAHVIDDLAALAAAARAAGVPLAIQSAYRSHRKQERTFRTWVRQMGLDRAMRVSARPGHSEHQLGITVDLKALGGGTPWSRGWQRTPTSQWLAANAWRHGFSLSYPKDAYDTTCYDYESWHFRYVGREIAQAIQESGMPPRVWMLTQPEPTPSPNPNPTAQPTESAEASPAA